jgi:endonuclease/exonuclease/phosphatase family metal-dependent hydrolase
MKRVLIGAATVLAVLGATPAAASPAAVSLRVLNYNIHYAVPQGGSTANLDTIIAEIRAEQPDVVTLQEVHIDSVESGHVNQVVRLAEELGMYYQFGDNDTSEEPGSQQPPFEGTHGNLILSKYRIVERVNWHLPRAPEDNPTRVTRGCVGVRLDVNGTDVRVYNTQLTNGVGDASKHSRALQVDFILGKIGNVGGRVVFAGDLNAVDTEAPVRDVVANGFADTARDAGPTSPQQSPTVRIDYVFSKALTGSAAHVPTGGGSDHRPVVVDLAG